MKGPRPPCRCEERKEALARIADATLRGDFGAIAKERAFIRQSLMQDVQTTIAWTLGRAA